MKLKAATYNIAAGLSGDLPRRKNYFNALNVIDSLGADIIALNEVGKKLPQSITEYTEFIAQRCGYKYYSFGNAVSFGKYPYGNAILSKFPIVDTKIVSVKKYIHIFPGIYEPRCILSSEINISSNLIIRIISTHLGLFPDEQRLGLSKVTQLITSSDLPTVFMGDLNTDKNSKILNPVKAVLKDACETRGVTLNTYPSIMPRIRPDHIFVSKNISVADVFTVCGRASDHLPLAAELEVFPSSSSKKH